MDPFSISIGVTGLAGLVAQTLSVAKGYISGVKSANDSVHALVIELETLQSSLSNLEAFLKENNDKGPVFRSNSALCSCISACEKKMQDLSKKLGHFGENRRSRYLWPINEKEHMKTIQELRAFGQWINFSLSVDGWSLVSRTADDVVKVLEAQVVSFKVLQAIQDQAAKMQQTIENGKGPSESQHDAVQRRSILDWISIPAQEQKHQTVRSARVTHTGDWLLERQEYLQWRDEISEYSVLWCHGAQGSGKTVLASKVIDDLQGSTAGSRCLLAFYYFDYKDPESNVINRVLSNILAQLVAGLRKPPNLVMDAYEKNHNSPSLSQHELERLIFDTVKESERVYIIFDALDECSSSTNRKSLLRVLLRLAESQGLSILVTSRPHLSDIPMMFHTHSAIEIQAQESDIRAYVRQELGNSDVGDMVGEAFATRIADTLARRARGMFLLPILHLRTLLSQPTAGDMEDKLASMPNDLFVTFEETISRIQNLPEARVRLGMTTLMWICHAKRTLTVLEIKDALAVRFGQTSRCPEYCPTPKMIVDCCQGLVSIDPSTLHVRFVHYTIQEYFSQRGEQAVQQAHEQMAITCLTYLLFDTVQSGPHSDEDEISLIPDENPLASYASAHWGHHVRVSENVPNVHLAAMTFLSNRKARACAEQIRRYDGNYIKIYWTPEECYSVTALHVACRFALQRTLVSILDSGLVDINTPTKMGTTPLILAASSGHSEIVKHLLARGADPYATNWYGNSLQCAAEAGHLFVISQLVEHGMDPNSSDYYDRPLLHCTIDRDKVNAFRQLLNLGANPKALSKSGLNSLHTAILVEAVDITDMILERQMVDVDAKSQFGHCPIHLALESDPPIILQRLITYGADINAVDFSGKTPLDKAITCGFKEAAGVLQHHGAHTKVTTNGDNNRFYCDDNE